jgi:hypothetical protein
MSSFAVKNLGMGRSEHFYQDVAPKDRQTLARHAEREEDACMPVAHQHLMDPNQHIADLIDARRLERIHQNLMLE